VALALGRENDAAVAAPTSSLRLVRFVNNKLGTDFSVYRIMIVRKIKFLKSVQCFVKEDKTSPNFLGLMSFL
jgi:hypothetical protein